MFIANRGKKNIGPIGASPFPVARKNMPLLWSLASSSSTYSKHGAPTVLPVQATREPRLLASIMFGTLNKYARCLYLNRYFAVPIFCNPGTFLPVPLNQTYRLAVRTPSLPDNSWMVAPLLPAARKARRIFSLSAPRFARRVGFGRPVGRDTVTGARRAGFREGIPNLLCTRTISRSMF
jgi:hypothetical protein